MLPFPLQKTREVEHGRSFQAIFAERIRKEGIRGCSRIVEISGLTMIGLFKSAKRLYSKKLTGLGHATKHHHLDLTD